MDEKNDSSDMAISVLKNNAQTLAQELGWFGEVLNTRIKLYFKNEVDYTSVF